MRVSNREWSAWSEAKQERWTRFLAEHDLFLDDIQVMFIHQDEVVVRKLHRVAGKSHPETDCHRDGSRNEVCAESVAIPAPEFV